MVLVLPAASQCAITNLSVVAITPCDINGQYDVRIEVAHTNAPGTGTLDVAGQSFPFGASPTIVTLTGLPADGLPTAITALFSASNTCALTVDPLYTAPTCPNPDCAFTDVAVLAVGACQADGTYSATIELAFTNAPTSGVIDVNGQTFPVGPSPQMVVLSSLPGDGAPVNIAAFFSADPACATNVPALFTAPLCPVCDISDIAFVSSTLCDPGLQTYSADVTITFTNPPSAGSLTVNGAPYPIGTSPQTVTLINLPADGLPVDVTAFFGSDPACSNMVSALFTAPSCCAITAVDYVSDTGCDPATGLYDADITITSTNTPVTGFLVVNGISYALAPSPQTVTLTGLVADGMPVDISAFYSAFPGCTNETLALFTAPTCPVPSNVCAITSLAYIADTGCNPATGTYDVRIEVAYTNAPTNGTLDVNGQAFPISASPQLVTLTGLPADGLPVDVSALFSADPACSNEVVALFVAPVCPPPTNACAITGLAYIADTGCNPATGTYDVRIEVAYTNAPTNGTLDVNGQAFPISASPQLVTLTGLPADGLPVDVFALFSADPACSNEVVALFNAPVCPVPTNACAITSVLYIADTGCDPLTGTYDVDIEVAYTNAPTNGMLDVNGQVFPISVSPQLVTLTGLVADGLPVDVSALFTADPACSNEVLALFVAPVCPVPTNACAITGLIYIGDTGCDPATGTYDVDIEVAYTNAPTNGMLDVNGQMFPISVSPQVVTLTGLVADGLPVDVSALFTADPACSNEVSALFVAPVCPPPTNACAITSLIYISDTGCDPATGTYTVDIEVGYTNAPTNGMLDVNGQMFPISISPQVVTLTGLPADGSMVDVSALFTADPTCTNEVLALYTAPLCPGLCAITNLQLVSVGACDSNGNVTVTLDIFATNAIGLPFDVTSAGLPVTGTYTSTPTTVVITDVPGNGLDFTALVLMDNGVCSLQQTFPGSIPICPGSCAITNLALVSVGACNPGGTVDVVLEIAYTNAPTNGTLDVNGIPFPITTSPQLVTLTPLGDGTSLSVVARFSADFDCVLGALDLVQLPVCSNACDITNITLDAVGPCKPDGTVDIDVTVFYTNAPTNGTIDILSQPFAITGSPQTETLSVPGVGGVLFIPVEFSANPACQSFVVPTNFIPLCTGPTCAISNLAVTAVSACDSNGNVSVTLEVTASAPTGTVFDVFSNGSPTSFVFTASPATVTVTDAPGNGAVFPVFVQAQGLACSIQTNFAGVIPVCAGACAITNLAVTSIGACNADGTVDVLLELSYTNAPTNGTLNVNGLSFPISGSPQQVMLNVPGDGMPVDVIANFSADLNCFILETALFQPPVCTTPCAITNVVAAGPFACDTNGMSGFDVTVFYTNGPTNGMLDVNGVMVPVTNSPQTVTLSYPGDGSTQDVVIAFTADTNCIFTALAALPLPLCTTPTNPPVACAITNVVAAGPFACDTNGMSGFDVTVFYTNGPTNGMLDVNGVMVPVTNSPQTVTLIYPGDGSTQDVFIAFTADTNCMFTALAALPLPLCTTPTNPPVACAITNVVAAGPFACDTNGMSGFDVTVFYTNGPTNGMLDVNGVMVPVTNSPQTVTLSYPGDGSTQDVVIAFTADTNCIFTALAALPLPLCTTPTNPAPVCAITNVVANGPIPCDASGMTGYDITVFYANGPTNGTLDVNGVVVPVTTSPQTVSLVYPGDGSTQDVVIAFSADTGCVFTALSALPLPVCNPCSILSVAPGAVSACDVSNGTFSAEIIVVHTNAPTNGTLDVNGQAFAVTSSPQVVTLTNLVADGLPVSVSALFSADPACAFSVSNVFLAPLCVSTSGFALAKSGSISACPDPATGLHTITYSVVVSNGSPNSVTNLFLRDSVGAFIGAEFVSAAVTSYAGPSNLVANTNFTGLAPNNLLLGAGTLGTNETATVTFDVLVDPATPCSGTYINQATFSLDGTNLLAASQVVTNMVPSNSVPTLTCPTGPIPFTLTTNAPTVTITAADIGPLVAMDDCGIVSTSVVSQTFGCFDVGLHSITATVFDACGQSATCVVPIEIICNINVTQLMPVIGIDLAVADPGCFCGTNSPGTFLISITNGGPVAITNVVVSDPLYPSCATNIPLLAIGGTFSYMCPVVLTGTTNMVVATGEANGMTAMADAGVGYSFDTEAPSFFGCPADVLLGCADALPGPVTNLFVVENCASNGVTVNVTSNPLVFCTGPGVEYIYTPVDACGNVGTPCTQTISRATSSGIAFTNTVGDMSLACGAAVPAPMNLTATNCTGSIAASVTSNALAAGCAGVDGIQYVYTAADGCGNSVIATQTITFIDAAAPVFSTPIPAGMQLTCGQALPAALSPTATDDCGAPSVSVNTTPLPGSCSLLNGVQYVYMATDGCGNSVSATQTFTYAAIGAPVLSALPPGGTIECGGNVPPPQNLTALDGCGNIVSVSLNTGSLAPNCTGQSGVRYTYTATDACGVSTVHTEDWTYIDSIGPTITCGPNQTITRITSACLVPVPFVPRNAFDSCAQVNVTQSPAVGTQHNASTPLVVTLTATDACGNQTVCVATYTYICDVALSGTVWNDLNMNGSTSDENLSALGLPGVDITIRDASGAVVATAITSANGFWTVDVPPGTYTVDVDTSDIPVGLPLISTQPSTVTAVSGTIPNLDYGVSPEPTAIELETLDATVVDGGVEIAWSTAWEENNLGFRVWRGTLEGPTEVVGDFILAAGQAASYQVTDDEIAAVYWLESVDADLNSEFDGPAETTIPAAPLGQPTTTIQAQDGTASFTAAADVASYLVIGFASEPTARDAGSGLRLGGEVIDVEGSFGIYLSVPAGTEVVISE